MVCLYALNIQALPDPLEDVQSIRALPSERQQKILNCRQRQKRIQSFGAGILLERVLSKHGLSPQQVYTDQNGKPMVEGAYFNLAHSGGVVICAISNMPVGCDIEQIKTAPKKVAIRHFSEEEKAYLNQFSNEEYDRAFFRVWTKKESYLKMIGTGLRVSLETVECKDCHVQEYEIDGYQVTVCAKEDCFAELVWEQL